MSKIQVTLPVMIHFEKEIETFLEARRRIEKLGDDCGVPIEVGAFVPFMPHHARTPENFAKQLANQEKHRLPIRLVETGIYDTNALSYVPGNPTYNFDKPSDLARTIDQSARLRDLDPTAPQQLVVAPHVGIFVLESVGEGDFSHPSIYSVSDFVKLRDTLYSQTKGNFAQLRGRAADLGLKLAIESSHLACFENVRFWQKQESAPEMGYQVFNDFEGLVGLSDGDIVLDANHLAVNRNVPGRFKSNNYDPRNLFATMDASSWAEYDARVGSINDYLSSTRALHISPTDGIGVRLKPGTEEGKRWGDGTGPDTTNSEAYNLLLRTARERELPVAIEGDYNLNPLTYSEADEFLEPVLREFLLS